MNAITTTRPIHPIEARRAFGADRDRPAVPGRIIGLDGDRAVVALVTGTWVTLAVDDPRYLAALERKDLTRYQDRELVVLINVAYRLFGLAVGPAEAPSRLAVRYGISRIEHGSVAEIPGEAPQPGWLVFRCHVEHVVLAPSSGNRVN